MTDPTIDSATYAALEEMAGAEFAAELVGTFLEEAPAMLATLRAACDAGAGEDYRRAAHSLKSNALTFGALTLASQAKALELGGLGQSSPAALAELDAEYARVAAALESLRHG